jgi:hypothetical protein
MIARGFEVTARGFEVTVRRFVLGYGSSDQMMIVLGGFTIRIIASRSP